MSQAIQHIWHWHSENNFFSNTPRSLFYLLSSFFFSARHDQKIIYLLLTFFSKYLSSLRNILLATYEDDYCKYLFHCEIGVNKGIDTADYISSVAVERSEFGIRILGLICSTITYVSFLTSYPLFIHQ